MNNGVLISGVQQSDLVTHIHESILCQVLFPFRLLQSIEQSSLCYTVGPCWLFILYIVVCVNPNLPIYPSPPFPLGNRSLFSTSVTLSLFCK